MHTHNGQNWYGVCHSVSTLNSSNLEPRDATSKKGGKLPGGRVDARYLATAPMTIPAAGGGGAPPHCPWTRGVGPFYDDDDGGQLLIDGLDEVVEGACWRVRDVWGCFFHFGGNSGRA